MNRKVIVVVAIIIGIVGLFIAYMNRSIDVETVVISPQSVVEYFIEEGFVSDDEIMTVYSTMPGKISEIHVSENTMIEKGDTICVIDYADYEYNISIAKSNISAYMAQRNNLMLEDDKRRTEMESTRITLVGELNKIIAQEKDYLDQIAQYNDTEKKTLDMETINTDAAQKQLQLQIELQEILIEKSAKDLENSEKDFNNAKQLYDTGAISKNEYDNALNAVNTRRLAHNADIKQLELYNAEIIQSPLDISTEAYLEQYKSSKKALEERISDIDKSIGKNYISAMEQYYTAMIEGQQTQIDLLNKNISESTIISPVSGKIEDLYINDTNIVSVQNPILSIITSSSKDIEVYVMPEDVSDLSVGDTVEIIKTQNSGDIVFGGTIKAIDDKATMRATTRGTEERRWKITVKPDENENVSFGEGMPFDIKFIVFSGDNQITISKSAVFQSESLENYLVWVVVNGKLRLREVELGREQRNDYIIDRGLEANDVVVKNCMIDGLSENLSVK